MDIASVARHHQPQTVCYRIALMRAAECTTIHELAKSVGLPERYVSRQLRLAYLAPEVLKRQVFGREVMPVTDMQPTESAALPWHEQSPIVFEATS